MRWTVYLVLGLLLSACAGQQPDPVATGGSTPVAIVRALVTVELPPTLSRAERLATRQAQPVTPTPPPPTQTPTPTPYVGVFLGEAASDITVPRIVQPTLDPLTNPSVLCAVPIDPTFGTAWRQNPTLARRIGCALQERFGFAADVQVFERGVMYRRQETGEVWGIRPEANAVGRFWFASQPPLVLPFPLNVPEGLRPPSEVFLPLWVSDPQIQLGLGFGRTPQQTADLNVQRVEGGTFFLDVTIAQVFVLLDNGDVYGPF
ncbi:MAG: hypothetical protein MUC99_00815 [Anaerolineae bacterium]|jgi:hypothetical protein|nr:hypothetical protein [Anaerolineae bacterium]